MKKCFVDKAYHLLGAAPDEVLREQWIKLSSEFYFLSGDENVLSYVQEWSELYVLESKIFRIKSFVEALQIRYSPAIANVLRLMGYKHKFTPESYQADLQSVLNKVGNIEARIKMLMTEIQRKRGDQVEQAVTYSTFDSKLSQIERAFKVPVNPKDLTAQMFALKIKDLNEYLAAIEADREKDE